MTKVRDLIHPEFDKRHSSVYCPECKERHTVNNSVGYLDVIILHTKKEPAYTLREKAKKGLRLLGLYTQKFHRLVSDDPIWN
jgi:hypothetical protein